MPFASARYSPSVSDDLDSSGTAAPPPASAGEPPGRRGSSNGVVGWLIVAAVVLVLAVAGGLFTAFIVANMRAVPGPVAGASATPTFTSPSSAPAASASVAPPDASEAPRRTPTPVPTTEVTAPPFTYVVQPGDHLVNIADMFAVSVQDIIDLNDIKNPNRLFVGQELLIPGYGVQPTPKPTKTPRK